MASKSIPRGDALPYWPERGTPVPPKVPPMSTPTRGIRNHNPGNIDRTGEKWQGMAEDQSGDKRFIVFKEAKWGIRAIAVVLKNYQSKHNLRTTEQIINRWAPPVENNTSSYIDAVAKKLRVRRTDPIDVNSHGVMFIFVSAIIQHENGTQPYDVDTINEALALAGITA